MSRYRYFVPAVFVALVSGLALTLIVGIVARSPETHGNVYPEGYDRTPISYVGEEVPFEGMGLADPDLVTDLDAGTNGRLLFLSYSCASCHSLTGQGGTLGPDLNTNEIPPSEFRRKVRSGPEGMPDFVESVLSAENLEDLYTFLEASHQEAFTAPAETTAETTGTRSSRAGRG